jgi:hypothetical protein
MSKWVFDAVWIVAAMLGIVLTVMYFRAAQKLYARDKQHPPSQRDVRPTGEPPSSQRSPELLP